MDTYDALIQQEQAKLALLKQKVAACELRIAALRTLAQTDDVDDAIATAVGRAIAARSATHDATPLQTTVADAPALHTETVALSVGRKVRSDSIVIEVLSFLRGGVRSLDEVAHHLDYLSHSRSRGYLRTALMNWRVNNGWVLNPHPGRYGLSDAGAAFLDANKGESPSTANAEAFILQPSPGPGTTAAGG